MHPRSGHVAGHHEAEHLPARDYGGGEFRERRARERRQERIEGLLEECDAESEAIGDSRDGFTPRGKIPSVPLVENRGEDLRDVTGGDRFFSGGPHLLYVLDNFGG